MSFVERTSTIGEADVTQHPDGSADIVTVGGTDPHFTPEEANELASFLTGISLEDIETAETAPVTTDLPKADLVAIAADAGLPTSGTKADLVDRINEAATTEDAPADEAAE